MQLASEIRACRCCGTDIVPITDLGTMPPANRLCPTAAQAQALPQYPLVMGLCEACGLAQLTHDCPPEELFSDYPYFSSFSSSWLAHARRFARHAIEKLNLSPNDWVVEIASNDGYLLQYFKEAGCKVLGVDPADTVVAAARAKGVETHLGFFNEQVAGALRKERGPARLIVANNVLAHVVDPVGLLRGVRSILAADGVFSCEFPHLLRIMDSVAFDTIYHEHFSYISLTAAMNLYGRAGLQIIEVERLSTQGGSLRVWAKPQPADAKIHASVAEVLDEERARNVMHRDGFARIDRDARNVRRILTDFLDRQAAAGKVVMGYGAAAKGITLLNYADVKPAALKMIADLNPAKQNRFTPKNAIPIVSVETLLAAKPDLILILPWNLREEITQQLVAVRQWGGKFAVVIPALEIF